MDIHCRPQYFKLFHFCVRERAKGLKLWFFFNFSPMALRPNADHGLLILEVSRSHTTTHHIRGRTRSEKRSAPRRDLFLTTHNTHNRKTTMPPAGFEPIISAGERPQIYALDSAGTGTGLEFLIY